MDRASQVGLVVKNLPATARDLRDVPLSSLGHRKPFLPDPLTRETQFFFFLRALGVHNTTTAMKFQTGATLVLQIKKEEKIGCVPYFSGCRGAPFLFW